MYFNDSNKNLKRTLKTIVKYYVVHRKKYKNTILNFK